MKDLWMPLLNGVHAIELEKACLTLDIDKVIYFPDSKHFALSLKSLEFFDYAPSDIRGFFKDWTCEIDTSVV